MPASGHARTLPAPCPHPARTAADFADFLEHGDPWVDELDPSAQHIYAILDHLSAHPATDILLVSLPHPRWEVVCQPTDAAYLNLIEPWWKILRALALKGHRFETRAELCHAVEAATAYWNAHRHPVIWGRRRRRHRPRWQSGIALVPRVA